MVRTILTGYSNTKAPDTAGVDGGKKRGRSVRREQAEAFLRHSLRFGPKLANEVVADANQKGIASRTLRRAATALGVLRTRDAFGGPVTWRLPAGLPPSS